MKILIVINTLNYGGAEKQAVSDANSLSSAGHDVTLAFHTSGDLAGQLSPRVRQYRIGSKRVVGAALILFVHFLFSRYDVVHCHMFWAERVCVLPAKLTGQRVVFNEHGLGLWRRWYHVLIMRLISMLADRVVVSCRVNYRVRMEKEKLDPEKMMVIYNSINENGGTKPFLHRLDALNGKFVVGYVGRFSAVKRLDLFLDIADRLRERYEDFRIALIGGGDGRQTLQAKIADRRLEKYFYIPGFAFDVDPYYKNFDIYVLPSRVEGFSLSLLEAGAAGIPSIAFDVGGNSEIIRDGVNGYLVPDDDIARVSDRIIYLREHEDIRKNMGLAARRLIRNTFTASRRTENLQELYRGLL
jgi:glycosyltransferase involved in cell wall biosynthesis